MNECVVLIDMRANGGGVTFLSDEKGYPKRFENYNDALDVISDHTLNVFPWIIIQLDKQEWSS
jgi:hypothetical protein